MTSVKLFSDGADMRCQNLLLALKDIVYERGKGMPVPSVIGTIEILKNDIIREQRE